MPPMSAAKVVYLVDAAASSKQAVIGFAQVENFELIRGAGFVFRALMSHTPEPNGRLLSAGLQDDAR